MAKCKNGNCHNDAKRGHALCPACIKEANRMDLPQMMYLVTDDQPKEQRNKAQAVNQHRRGE